MTRSARKRANHTARMLVSVVTDPRTIVSGFTRDAYTEDSARRLVTPLRPDVRRHEVNWPLAAELLNRAAWCGRLR